MAKRKTPKKDKIVDLTPKPEKITDTQLNKLQSTIKTIDHITMELGQMEVKKFSLLKAMKGVQDDITDLREYFKREYGTDNINIQDGTIGYDKEPNTDSND